MRKPILAGAALAAALVLGGCTTLRMGSALAPATPRAAVLAQWGVPTRVASLPVGERWQYSLQPWGRKVWMVDLDAAGNVVRTSEVMNETSFLRIEPGRWTRADVEREFGPVAYIDRVANWPGPIMTYRWNDDINDMFFWVYLDERGVVQRAHAGVEYTGPQQPDKP